MRYLFGDLIGRARRKIFRASRRRAFRAKTAPFVHRGSKGLLFELHPGEYIDQDIFTEGIFEAYPLRWLGRNLRGRTFVDIGANIGNHLLYLAEYFDEVHGFEPYPPVADRLQRNIDYNGARATVHRVGLGVADADLPYHANVRGNLGGGSFARADGAEAALPVRNGDQYFRAHGIRHVDLLKIDVEGMELSVLEGLRETIERDRPTIMLEFDGRMADARGLEDLLPGYRIEELVRGGPRPWVAESRPFDNLLARPMEKRA